ncbi:MAG TPA: hypothetical protein VGD67_21870 [Pseudonocardiaceae bacterium]
MPASLATAGVVVVREFIDQRLARMLYAMLLLRRHRGEARHDDHMPGALSFWGDSTLDAFHLSVRPDVETVAAGPLLPTYCYARLYRYGDTLHRHHDREACEIVATVHVGHRGGAPPPICFATGHVVHQRPGDAVVFHGSAIDHWRDVFLGEDFGQVFMNFVRADGPHRDQALDGRIQAFPRVLVPYPAAVRG